MDIAPFRRKVKCDRLDTAFRMVNTLFPIYVAIAIDTTYANNQFPNARQMEGRPSSRTYCKGRLYLVATKLLLPLPSLRVIWSWYTCAAAIRNSVYSACVPIGVDWKRALSSYPPQAQIH